MMEGARYGGMQFSCPAPKSGSYDTFHLQRPDASCGVIARVRPGPGTSETAACREQIRRLVVKAARAMNRLAVFVWKIAILGMMGLSLADAQEVGRAPADTAKADTTAADSTGEAAWARDAWTEITRRRGARLSYIFYREADTENDGVVIRVDNDNDVPIVYDFTVVFRSAAGREVTDEARGAVPPKTLKTGDMDGRGNLFWIPFPGTEETIDQVGVRRLKVWHVPPERLEEVKRKFGITDDTGR